MTPTYAQMFHVFGRIGLLSFGGPAAQIALMHKELVEDRDWLTEQQFLRALSFCMLLPGPEAMQLATYAGWRQRGIPGGLLAGGLFVIPGAIVIAGLVLLYALYGTLPVVQAAFLGVQAAVVVIVVQALRKVMGKALNGPLAYGIALAAFIALYAFDLPFPLVILVAAGLGAAFGVQTAAEPTAPVNIRKSVQIIGAGCLLWFAPLTVAVAMDAPFLTDVGLFFSKLAVVTFGGAYAVLAYMTQTVVADYGWITTAQMMDALGLAETTPGPLILVTQFVGMLAGYAQEGLALAVMAGALTLWVTFVPCFIWIFAGAPLIDWLGGQPRLQAALHGITAAVVGVIANLGLWFALHVFFASLVTVELGPLSLLWPQTSSIAIAPLALSFFAAFLMFWAKRGLLLTLAACAAAALALFALGLV